MLMIGAFLNTFCGVRSVYTERQRCDNSAMTLALLLSLKSMETLENGLQTHSGVSLQSYTTTLHFIWSDIADASLTLGVNGYYKALMLFNGTFPLSVNGTSAGVRTMGTIDNRFNIYIPGIWFRYNAKAPTQCHTTHLFLVLVMVWVPSSVNRA